MSDGDETFPAPLTAAIAQGSDGRLAHQPGRPRLVFQHRLTAHFHRSSELKLNDPRQTRATLPGTSWAGSAAPLSTRRRVETFHIFPAIPLLPWELGEF